MKKTVALMLLVGLAPLARSEEIWRWQDAKGTLCYSNRAEVAPPEASTVKTRLIVEAERLPGAPDLTTDEGTVIDARERRPAERMRHKRHRIYSEKRLRFACYASNILYAGGWSHSDDINVVGNCLPYLLGPEAWLNAARAELGLREHGIDWRQLVPMYLAQQDPTVERRVTYVSDVD